MQNLYISLFRNHNFSVKLRCRIITNILYIFLNLFKYNKLQHTLSISSKLEYLNIRRLS